MSSLSYAKVGSGKLAYAIGWINWGTLTLTPGMATKVLSYSLPGGVTLSFSVGASGTGSAITTVIPTWGGAAMGVQGYTNIAGNCALYGSGNFNVNINNIVLTDSFGNTLPNVSFYFADAEATNDFNEYLGFTSDEVIYQVDVYPNNYPCPPYVGEATLTVTIGGSCTGAAYNSRIFQSNNASNLTCKIISTGGLQGMAMGFSLQEIILQKDIGNRIDQTDQFELVLSNSIINLTTLTDGINNGIQSQTLYDFGNVGEVYTIDENMGSGSASSLVQYVQTISIVNTAGGSIPAGVVLGGTVPLNAGDFLVVTIKNTPNFPYIKPIKIAPSYGFQGDILSYTIVLANTSPNAATNLILVDTEPNGTTFVPNSIYINGVQTTNNLPNISVGTIPANSVTTVSFNVTVNTTIPKITPINNSSKVIYSYTLVGTTPNLQYLSNIVQTTILDKANLIGSKYTNRTTAKFGDIVTYTIVYRNLGSITASNISFVDTIPINTTFIQDSVYINGIQRTGVSPIAPGFLITIPATVATGEVVTISFNVLVDTIISPTTLVNLAEAIYSYTPVTTPYIGVSDTNTVATIVRYIDLSIKKIVNRVFSYTGDILTYEVLISSVGNIDASNVIFVDTLQNSLQFINNTLKYDNNLISGDIFTGVNLGTISGISTHTIEFQAMVK